MSDDRALLRKYAAEGCESAFRELLERHLPLVYSAALRQVGGDRHLAQDVSQHVFAELARCASTLSSDVIVAGWLYQATRFAAAKMARSEKRRRIRENTAALAEEMERMNASLENHGPDWDALSTQLDEAMNELEETDRTAILLRFFQRLDFRAVGAALKTSDDTAQKRVSRALEKLRMVLTRRGVALSTVGLGGLLLSNAAAVPPPELIASVLAHVGAGATGVAAGAGAGLSGKASLFFTSKAVYGLGVLAAVAGWLFWHSGKEPAGRAIPPGLVSWWTADGSAVDRAGKNHGVLEGAVDYVPGISGQAFRFDGREGTRVRVPHHVSLSLTNEVTLEFWFRPDEDSVMGSLVMKRSEDTNAAAAGNLVNYGFSMGRIHPDHQYGICQYFNDPEVKGGYHARSGEVSFVESLLPNVNLPPLAGRFASKANLFEQSAFFPTEIRDLSVLRGRWHHLAGTFKQLGSNRVRMTSYFDGERRNQIILSGTLANTINDAPLSIGGFPTSPFKGCIDEVRLFARELSPKEISGLAGPSLASQKK